MPTFHRAVVLFPLAVALHVYEEWPGARAAGPVGAVCLLRLNLRSRDLFNALFHLGATIRYRQYCPGAITGMVLYLPLAIVLLALSIREAAIGPQAVVWALTVAAVFHTLEVGHSVFKRW